MNNTCVKRIYGRRGLTSKECGRRGIFQENSKWFCGIHNPERRRVLDKARQEKYEKAQKEGKMSEEWVLTLNKYQRDNLLWLLNACGYPYPEGIVPFTLANTGDWLGEIAIMLDPGGNQKLADGDRPNHSIDQLRNDVDLFLSRIRPIS